MPSNVQPKSTSKSGSFISTTIGLEASPANNICIVSLCCSSVIFHVWKTSPSAINANFLIFISILYYAQGVPLQVQGLSVGPVVAVVDVVPHIVVVVVIQDFVAVQLHFPQLSELETV